MADRLVMSRLVRREDAGRELDVEFWQRLGDEKIFAILAKEFFFHA